jgi:hypothetical protein
VVNALNAVAKEWTEAQPQQAEMVPLRFCRALLGTIIQMPSGFPWSPEASFSAHWY